ncbi:MAG TPA: TlpA disulfide reductase family protein [Streptosporangiaceae bacterium]|nr:TlpA disulfide reductase family protein [Streptosporangiaceae bacterium]
MTRLQSSARHAAGTARALSALAARPRAVCAMLAGTAVLALASCSGGAIAQNTPVSSGQSFVGGSYSSTYYSPGSRPAAPAVDGTMLTGSKFRLSADRGNVVVLNFWGSWCAPCRSEAPALAALATHFKSAPVRFVGDDVHDSPAAAQAFERTFNVGYPSLNDPGEQVALAFHGTVPPVAIPTTLLIDRTGHIAGRIVGGVTYRSLLALITKVLAGQS